MSPKSGNSSSVFGQSARSAISSTYPQTEQQNWRTARPSRVAIEPLLDGVEIGAPIGDKEFDNDLLRREFDQRGALVTACGRICLHRKKINVSTVFAGQRLGIKEVGEGVGSSA